MIYRRGPRSQGGPHPQRIVNSNTFGWGGQGSQPGFGDSASLKSCPFCPSGTLGSAVSQASPNGVWSFHRLSTRRGGGPPPEEPRSPGQSSGRGFAWGGKRPSCCSRPRSQVELGGELGRKLVLQWVDEGQGLTFQQISGASCSEATTSDTSCDRGLGDPTKSGHYMLRVWLAWRYVTEGRGGPHPTRGVQASKVQMKTSQ